MKKTLDWLKGFLIPIGFFLAFFLAFWLCQFSLASYVRSPDLLAIVLGLVTTCFVVGLFIALRYVISVLLSKENEMICAGYGFFFKFLFFSIVLMALVQMQIDASQRLKEKLREQRSVPLLNSGVK